MNVKNAKLQIFKIFKIAISLFLLLSLVSCPLDKGTGDADVSLEVVSGGDVFENSQETDYKDVYVYGSSVSSVLTLSLSAADDVSLDGSLVLWSIESNAMTIDSGFRDEFGVKVASPSSDGKKLDVYLSQIKTLGEYRVVAEYGGKEASYSFSVDTKNTTPLSSLLDINYVGVSVNVDEQTNKASFSYVQGSPVSAQIVTEDTVKIVTQKACRISLDETAGENPYGRLRFKINDADNDVYFLNSEDGSFSKEFTTSDTSPEVYLLNSSPENTLTSISVNAGESLHNRKDFTVKSISQTVDAALGSKFELGSSPCIDGNEVIVTLTNKGDGDLYDALVKRSGAASPLATLSFDEEGCARYTVIPESFNPVGGVHTDEISVCLVSSASSVLEVQSEYKEISLYTNATANPFSFIAKRAGDAVSSPLLLYGGKESAVRRNIEDESLYSSWSDFEKETPVVALVVEVKDVTEGDEENYADANVVLTKTFSKYENGSNREITQIISSYPYMVNKMVNTESIRLDIADSLDKGTYQARLENVKGSRWESGTESSYTVNVSEIAGSVKVELERMDTSKKEDNALYMIRYCEGTGEIVREGEKTLLLQYSTDAGATWSEVQRTDLYTALSGARIFKSGTEDEIRFTYKDPSVLIRTMIVGNDENVNEKAGVAELCVPSSALGGNEYVSLDRLEYAPPSAIADGEQLFYNGYSFAVTKADEDYKLSYALVPANDGGQLSSSDRPAESEFMELSPSVWNYSPSSDKDWVYGADLPSPTSFATRLALCDADLKTGKNRVWIKTEDETGNALASYTYKDFTYIDCNDGYFDGNGNLSTKYIVLSDNAGLCSITGFYRDESLTKQGYVYLYRKNHRSSRGKGDVNQVGSVYDSSSSNEEGKSYEGMRVYRPSGAGFVSPVAAWADGNPQACKTALLKKGARTSATFFSEYTCHQKQWYTAKYENLSSYRLCTETCRNNLLSSDYYKSK